MKVYKMSKADLQNKMVFLTGVAGFSGSNLVKRLFAVAPSVKNHWH